MRFEQLRTLTGLPVDRIRRRFRNEEVGAVLPATVGDGAKESLLVATSQALAIVTGDRMGDGEDWMLRWVPWEVVRISDGTNPWTAAVDDEYQLFVEVGGLTFTTSLPGEDGRKALRDFVVAARTGTGRAALVD